MPGVNRMVPIHLTNLASTPIDLFPAPLHISSLENLTQVYREIARQVATERSNGENGRPDESGGPRGSMGHVQSAATATDMANDGSHLPADGAAASGERER